MERNVLRPFEFDAALSSNETHLRMRLCHFLEMVLPLYERMFPEDSRPRRSISTAASFVFGNGSEKDAQKDALAAIDAAKDAALRSADSTEYALAEMVALAASAIVESPQEAISYLLREFEKFEKKETENMKAFQAIVSPYWLSNALLVH